MDCAKLDSMVERMKNAFMKYMNAKEKVEESYRNTCSKFLTTLSELNEKHMLVHSFQYRISRSRKASATI